MQLRVPPPRLRRLSQWKLYVWFAALAGLVLLGTPAVKKLFVPEETRPPQGQPVPATVPAELVLPTETPPPPRRENRDDELAKLHEQLAAVEKQLAERPLVVPQPPPAPAQPLVQTPPPVPPPAPVQPMPVMPASAPTPAPAVKPPDPKEEEEKAARKSPLLMFSMRDNDKAGERAGARSKGDAEATGTGIQRAKSPYTLSQGWLIPATLQTGLNSTLPGPVIARVRETVYDSATGRYVLIPQGATLIGTYDEKALYGQDRIYIAFTRVVFPNGDSVDLDSAPGLDSTGYAGATDTVNHHYLRLLGAVLISSVLSVGARSAVPYDNTTFRPSLGEQYAQDVSQNINQAGQQMVQKQLQIKPTIVVRPGYLLHIFVRKDLVLEPYPLPGRTRRE